MLRMIQSIGKSGGCEGCMPPPPPHRAKNFLFSYSFWGKWVKFPSEKSWIRHCRGCRLAQGYAMEGTGLFCEEYRECRGML